MTPSQQRFIELCIAEDILRFGAFTLKSGRVSPYFFNAGLFSDGRLLSQLADAYADLIAERIAGVDKGFMLYGPAYKGIPLAAATAIRLADRHSINLPYAFNRKEAKDHGEGGTIIGAALRGKIIIIDDVITAGTSVGESVEVILKSGAEPAAVVIAVDRQERAGESPRSAVQAVEAEYKMPVHAIIALEDLVTHLQRNADKAQLDAVVEYRRKYGTALSQ